MELLRPPIGLPLYIASPDPQGRISRHERFLTGALGMVRAGITSLPAMLAALQAKAAYDLGQVGYIGGQTLMDIPPSVGHIFSTAAVVFLGALVYDTAQVGTYWGISEKLNGLLQGLRAKPPADPRRQ